MTNRLENVMRAASAAVFIFSGYSAISNANDAGSIDAQMRQNPQYAHSLVLDDASGHLSAAERDITYKTGSTTIKAGDVTISVPYTDYPDGVTAWNEINYAVSELNQEPRIAGEILNAADSIPREEAIKQYHGAPANDSAFDKEKRELEAIRAEIGSLSQADKSDVASLQREKDAATLRFAISLFGLAVGVFKPLVYLLEKEDEWSKARS